MNDIIYMGVENDGKITLTFLNNNLEVHADFYPPLADGAPITGDYLRIMLESHNIIYGVQHDNINYAYNLCVDGGETVRNILIAKGDAPVNEIPEYMQLNPFLGKSIELEEHETVDHRARSPFVIVKKGQALAKQKHRKPGVLGTNVHGENISFEVKKVETVSGGENTRMEGRFLVSSINGQLVQSKGVLSVRDFLVIKGSVDYNTGNIIFPGDVEIHGIVSDGFRIHTGGALTIKQTFDVTEAVTKGNLNVAGGIIGRGQALVKVGGNLKTKFIQNCRVACRKTINVDTEIINSKVYTMENLEMGEKGCIVGGEIYSVNGVRAASIGKDTGKAARIHCGIDFTIEQEKEKSNGLLKILAAKLKRLKEYFNDPQMTKEKKEKIQSLINNLEEEQRKTQAKISELLGKSNTNKDAVIEVSGSIVSGTLIEICDAALFVTEPLKKVRISFNRETKKLVTAPLK